MKKTVFWSLLGMAAVILCVKMSTGFELTILDSGQGDCIYIADGYGGHYLVDGGSSDKSDLAKYQMIPFLKYKGVTKLDGVIVTHPDKDHISGILSLLQSNEEGSISVRNLFLPDIDQSCRNEEYRQLEQYAAESYRKSIAVRYFHKDMVLRNGDFMLTCLHPEKNLYETDTNAYSTVLWLKYREFTALLTGDLEGPGEMSVTSDWDRGPITLLKVAHHGSGYSTSEEFLTKVRPAIAVISAGKNNKYGHPHRETVERLTNVGSRIYSTIESGAITIKVRRGRVSVHSFM